MNATAGFGNALTRLNIVEAFFHDKRGVPIIDVAIAKSGTQPSVRNAEQLARLLTMAPLLYTLVVEATKEWE